MQSINSQPKADLVGAMVSAEKIVIFEHFLCNWQNVFNQETGKHLKEVLKVEVTRTPKSPLLLSIKRWHDFVLY